MTFDHRLGALPEPLSDGALSLRPLLESGHLDALAEQDQQLRNRGFDHVSVSIDTSWPEIDRCCRSVQPVERELRRCARAWQSALSRAEEMGDEEVFASAGDLLDDSSRHPSPRGHAQGALTIRELAGPPFAALLEPQGEVWASLVAWPATSVAFALSAFGAPFEITTFDGCLLEGAWYAEDAEALGALTDVPRGRLEGLRPGPDARDRGHPRTFDLLPGDRPVGGPRGLRRYRPAEHGPAPRAQPGRHHVVVGRTRVR